MPAPENASDKFLNLAGPILGGSGARRVVDEICTLDRAKSMTALMQELKVPRWV
jgi:hypothetical protein